MSTTFSVELPQATAPAAGIQHSPPSSQAREQIRQAIMDAQQATNDAAIAGVSDGHAARAGSQPTIVITRGGQVVSHVPPVPPIPGVPSSTFPGDDGIPPQVVEMAYGFFAMCAVMVVGWPIARAFGRRIERSAPAPTLPPAATEQLHRIEQAVEAMSIEVERISESQRFMAKIQSGSTAQRV